MKVLCLHYAWPGSIRELENPFERGFILTDSNETIVQRALRGLPKDRESIAVVLIKSATLRHRFTI
ncbi:hypothetical protein FQP89_14220 [Vreelandella titanicae]|uniref:Uncharacterized protein n=1 Tax=Vreelandella titanicae TaxID=664683 RepID=A0A558J692_9GAMM|nr:hypothetical protein FQP89_14220 [Halomonas titanicae]